MQRRRVGLGEVLGTAGAGLVAAAPLRPWLELDLAGAYAYVRAGTVDLPVSVTARIWALGPRGEAVEDSAAASALGRDLGITATGWEQERWFAIGLVAAALLALIGVARAIRSPTAGGARRFGWMPLTAGLAVLTICAAELWWLGPAPGELLRPAPGLIVAAAGAACMVLASLMLGSTRRRRWHLDDEDRGERRVFENTEHLAYSHGAWVPRRPAGRDARGA